MTMARRLRSSCWRLLMRYGWYGCFDHAMTRERKGRRYVLVCQTCGQETMFPRQRLRAKRLNVVKPALPNMRVCGGKKVG